jgi:hypothetical protein
LAEAWQNVEDSCGFCKAVYKDPKQNKFTLKGPSPNFGNPEIQGFWPMYGHHEGPGLLFTAKLAFASPRNLKIRSIYMKISPQVELFMCEIGR